MTTLLTIAPVALLVMIPLASMATQASAATKANGPSVERGRYLTRIAGCNDCHTTGYAPTGGKVPEAIWLTGDEVGFAGPWGTTYPANLRLVIQGISEEQWVKRARTVELRPPMPWFALRDMTTDDLRSIYRFIRQLGSAGKPAPAYVPPGQQATGPVIQFPAPPK